MHFSRMMLKPVAGVAGWHAARQLRAFMEAHRQTPRVQDSVLNELIAAHAATAFGRDHGFSSLRTYEDFRSAVPVRKYEDLRPYMERVFGGEFDALIPRSHRVLMFAKTSGTTGEPKHIPVTDKFLHQMRRGWNMFGLKVLRDHPSGWLRAILQISSPMRESLSPSGVPCGAISGLLAARQKRVVRRMYVVPPGVSNIPDAEGRYYTILRCGVGRDVGIITTANPSSTIKIIETGRRHTERLLRDVTEGTIRPPGGIPDELLPRLRFRRDAGLARRMERAIERDGDLFPRHFWNVSFLTNWTGGTLKLYIPRLIEMFGRIPIRDIGLLASEGRFSLPLADGRPDGLAEITSNFLEFIPADEIDRKDPPALRCEQVEIGQEYFLVITNWAGLWRYNIDDRVRVTGFHHRSPMFEFLSRGGQTSNMTGEKITEYQVVEAMRLAGEQLGREVERFVLQGRFAEKPRYELRLEKTDGLDVELLAELMDRRLGELNVEYRSKRSSDRLGPIRPVVLPEGTMESTEQEEIRFRGGRSEQYKHQYLSTEVLQEV